MTYEWGYRYSQPMAVAPLPEVRRVVEYAVTRIPPEKIDLGIPRHHRSRLAGFFFGKSGGGGDGGKYRGGSSGSGKRARRFFMMKRRRLRISVMKTAEYLTRCGLKTCRSLRAKLGLVREYGLRGAGYWQIMRLFRPGWILSGDTFQIVKDDRRLILLKTD